MAGLGSAPQQITRRTTSGRSDRLPGERAIFVRMWKWLQVHKDIAQIRKLFEQSILDLMTDPVSFRD